MARLCFRLFLLCFLSLSSIYLSLVSPNLGTLDLERYDFLAIFPLSQVGLVSSDRAKMDPQHNQDRDHGRPNKQLRVMVITMGGYRKQVMEEQLMSCDVTFVEGVPSRGLRNRASFLRYCNQAGLLPSEEWEVLKDVLEDPSNFTVDLSELLCDVPVRPGRCGSAEYRAMHYSRELWCKAKALNRGRAVLACTLAHLMALRRFTEEQFDVLLEDNVRLDRDWYSRVLELQRTKELYEKEGDNNKVHMLYFGWLGSVPNLRWLYGARSRRFQDSLFSLPRPSEIEDDLATRGKDPASLDERQPGGNPVWGCYGYWISKEGYESALAIIRNDVGSLLWKRKRQRCYNVKPVDKILPRKIHTAFGPCSVQLPVRPLAYRAPMLTSKIHTQFDPDFCRSTTFQLEQNGLDWSDLGLTEIEKSVVDHWRETGQWKTPTELGLL